MKFALLLLLSVSAAAQTVVEYPVASGEPHGIALGPDGNVWFTERLGNRIGRITPDGVISEFDIPTPASEPMSIVSGPDGNLWFTEGATNKIGRITKEGTVTDEFMLPATHPGAARPAGITSGPDGNVWFTTSEWVGRITVKGVITLFGTNYGAGGGITTGPDGNLWFTAMAGVESKICHITPAGVNTAFGAYGVFSDPSEIVVGLDGNLWFTEASANRIDRLTTSGLLTQFVLPFLPAGIVSGWDGTLWITAPIADKVAQITTTGVVAVQYPLPTGSYPVALVVGHDGSVWFTEATSNKIGRIAPADRRRSVRRK